MRFTNSDNFKECFMNRAGQYITALGGIAGYKAYRPNPLPPFPEIEMDSEMINLFSKVHNYLGKL